VTVDNHENNASNDAQNENEQVVEAQQPDTEAAPTAQTQLDEAQADETQADEAQPKVTEPEAADVDAAGTNADDAQADGAEGESADAEPADSESTDTEATSSEPEPTEDEVKTPERDPRIPEVITRRTLFFLAPDLPPLPEAPRDSRGEQRHDDGDDDSSRSGRRSRSRRGGRGSESRDSGRDQRQQRDQRDDHDDDEPEAPQITEPQAVKGSTRLAAKRQRRRESRELGRRRTVVTESEFQARRESVDRKMLVRAKDGRVQIGVLEDNILVEHYVARNEDVSLIGNVYLGRVQNVLPSMEAAFVDIGAARNAVLYSGEVDWSAAELGPNTARKIENALKPGDKVLVQVTKDPVGHKGARLTSQVSLPGRYLVYVPGNSLNGISRKLPETERSRLKKILKEVLPDGVGVIVRTAAEGATQEQLQRDVDRLTKQWEDIQRRANSGGKGAQTLHAEPDMLIKIIRDVFNEDFHQLIIQGQSELDTIKSYLGQVAPDLLERVERYSGDDIFTEYKVNDMIEKALGRKVWLPSGGSLVIDRTEAMTVIDVNTGKFVGSGGNLEETVTKNNLEAAEEIIRQLRLRDIGGIIVIDFIDMVLESNRDLVHRRLVEGLSRDRTKHQVAEVTSLGLVQMTRKKIGLGLLETFSEPCDACAGRGVVVHSHPVNHGGGGNQSRGNKSRSNRGGNGGGNNNRGQNTDSKHQKSQNGGTHEITDDARNALTKIAASTMPGTNGDEAAREAAAQKLADAAAAAAAGKPVADVLAAAGETSTDSNDGNGNDNNGGDEREGRRSRRSRRGGRGRNKGNDQRDGNESQNGGEAQNSDDSQDNTAKQDAPAQRDTSDQQQPSDATQGTEAAPAAEPATRPDASESKAPARKSRRRISTGTVTADESLRSPREPEQLAIELPEAKPAAEKPELAGDPSAALASLDAALDSLAGVETTSTEPAQAAAPEQAAAPAAESKPKRRRRITTGPISTE
jgi:ribonuclease E